MQVSYINASLSWAKNPDGRLVVEATTGSIIKPIVIIGWQLAAYYANSASERYPIPSDSMVGLLHITPAAMRGSFIPLNASAPGYPLADVFTNADPYAAVTFEVARGQFDIAPMAVQRLRYRLYVNNAALANMAIDTSFAIFTESE